MDGKKKFESHMYGRNSRLDELQAGILVEKLKSLDRDNLKRLKIASIYNKAITSKHVITPKKEEILLMFTIYTLLNVRTEINY